ncbi:MAG: hypothetical protein AVDCRST_MAG89-2147, partial [uncultured Gemmatimonadetes bacterium]
DRADPRAPFRRRAHRHLEPRPHPRRARHPPGGARRWPARGAAVDEQRTRARAGGGADRGRAPRRM